MRTFSRASAGSAAQSRSCTTISDLLASANEMCQSIRACRADVGVGGLLRARGADREQLLADRDQHRGEQRVLGGEVLVERRPAHPAGGAEVRHGGAVEAAFGEEDGRGGQELFAAGGWHGSRLDAVG